MALRWWETVDIVESLANVTRQKATQVFGNIETRINQMEEQDITNQKAARQARAEAIQCAMKSQARAKAQVSIEEANKKLGALGCQNCLDSISSENLDRELSSNFQWSASMVRQYESESKQAREKAIYTQAEADAKILYENRTKKPWSKLLTAEKDAEISRWYQIYLKRAYPAEYGELTAEDRALATGGTAVPEAIPNLVQNQPWATQTTPQKTMEIPQDISEMTIPQGGVELGQGIRVMPDWSVWDSQNKIGTLNPKTQQFKAVGGGAGEGLKNLVVGFWNELNPSEYFTDPAKASLAQYKGTLVEWAKANSIPNPEEFVNNLFTAGTNSTGEPQLYWNVRSGNEIFLPVMPPEQEGKTGEQFVSEWLMPMVMMALLPSPTKLTGELKVIEAGGGVIGGAAKVAGRVIAPLKWMEHPIETLKVARGVFPATAMRAEEKALYNTMRAEGLISKVAPNPKPVPQRVVPPTNGWEKVTRGSTSGANGQWEAQLVGENSKIILARETLDHKPLVKDFTALENKLKLQKEIRYDTKTGKYFKVRKTITTIGKTNWDILKGSPQVQKALAAGAGFSDNEIANIVGKNWADLNPLQRSALRASAIQPQSVEKTIAAWNRMSVVERKAAVKGTPLEKKVGSLAFGALGAREKAELRLTFLTERFGIDADNKLAWQSAGSQQMGVNPAEVQSVIQKLTQVIKAAKPIREIEKGLKHSELMRRAGKMAGIIEQYEGKEGFEKGWSAMKGKLPTTEAQFAAPVITAKEEMMLYNSIKRSPVWKPWEIFEQSRTATALTKVLSGILPLDNEFALLEKQFGSEFVSAVMGKRALGAKAFEMAADVLNLPRAFLASWDLSAPLRQGALLFWGQPRQSIPALLPMIRAFGSDKFATMLEDAINTGAYAQLRRTAGLYLAPIHGRATGLLAREESFMTRFAGKLPMVKQSERAYVSYLNKLRADVFDNYAALWQGTKLDTVDNYKALAHAINVMTGRGDLPRWLAGGNQWLNAIFFSPRFMSSRIMLPVELIRTTPAVRTIMARNIVALTLANMSMFTLVYLATKDLPADQQASVEIDPRSTDFGKIKVGNTRVDFWGGFQPYARFVAQLITAERKTPDGMQALNRGDLIERFTRSKLSPAAGLFTDIVKGETYLGDEFALTSEAVADQAFQRLVPMSIQDIYEAMDDAGVTGLALSMPSFLGANVQTYGGVKLTKDDLNSLSQALYYKNWDELTGDEQKVINDWIGQ